MDGNGKMEVRRFTLWRDLVSEKLIVTISQPNKRIRKLKNYPWAVKIQKSFCGVLKENTLENLREFGEVIII